MLVHPWLVVKEHADVFYNGDIFQAAFYESNTDEQYVSMLSSLKTVQSVQLKQSYSCLETLSGHT